MELVATIPLREMAMAGASASSQRIRDIVAGRLILHFWWFVVAVILSTLLFQYVNSPLDTISQHAAGMRWTLGPFVIAALVLAPVLIWDSIRLSRKLVEPVEQVQSQLREFAREGTALEIPEEPDSLWSGLISECNEALRSADGLRLDTGNEGKSGIPSPAAPKTRPGRSRRRRHEA